MALCEEPSDVESRQLLGIDSTEIMKRRLRFGTGARGIERMEAAFTGETFAPHSHDIYAIGVTLKGVQQFRYRGARRHCLVGEGHVLHPDELHDGAPGTAEGFGYRILYIDPALIQEAVGGKILPFVLDPIIPAKDMLSLASRWLSDIDSEVGEIERLELVLEVTQVLQKHSRLSSRSFRPLALTQLNKLRELMIADPITQHSLEEFERISGLDRWTIARQFRAAFGASPRHFRTMRQLDLARAAIRTGMPLAEVAQVAGFSDQSHLTRMFKRAYGFTPSKWLALQV